MDEKQREIKASVPLLGENGELLHPGYATHMRYRYDRSLVAGVPFRLKEWDFYQVLLGDWVLQLTIGHVSYCTQLSAMLFSIKDGTRHTFSKMTPFQRKEVHMSLNPEQTGRLEAKGRGFQMRFESGKDFKRLRVRAQNGAEPVDIDLHLPWNRNEEKMVIATPFDKKTQFYLNCKEHYYGVRGHVRFGNFEVRANGTQTALLDWGRGVWPFHQEWFWGCGSAILPEGRFGFNIGWGFGDTRRATENMFFWNGKAHKLGTLLVERDKADYMAPWHFYTRDNRFDLTMTPIFDHYTETKLLFVDNCCHQVHGRFDGHIILPDDTPSGKFMEIHDVVAFCEHAINNW